MPEGGAWRGRQRGIERGRGRVTGRGKASSLILGAFLHNSLEKAKQNLILVISNLISPTLWLWLHCIWMPSRQSQKHLNPLKLKKTKKKENTQGLQFYHSFGIYIIWSVHMVMKNRLYWDKGEFWFQIGSQTWFPEMQSVKSALIFTWWNQNEQI